MFHLLKTFEWDSIIKCYIKIHYLNALGTKLFFIAMPHCTYFVHNFKTFRRHFFACQIIFFTKWLKVINYFWVNEYKCVYLDYIDFWTKLLKITYSCCYIFFFISDDHFILVQNVKCWFFFHISTGRCYFVAKWLVRCREYLLDE